jgi:hypothetical protein
MPSELASKMGLPWNHRRSEWQLFAIRNNAQNDGRLRIGGCHCQLKELAHAFSGESFISGEFRPTRRA